MSVVFEKPRFSVDQMTSATDAAKRFAEVRKRAKKEPQYITDHNVVDSVILSYEDYEALYAELAAHREQQLLSIAAQRISQGDADPHRTRVSLHDAMTEEEYADFLACNADSIPDEDLFE